MLNPSALLSTSIALLIHTSVLASTPVLQTREIEAEEFDYNCQNFIILRKDVNSHVKDACTALKFSPEFNTFPAYFEESYLFPAYNDRVLFSWPVYLGTKRFQPGNTLISLLQICF
ncbi:BgtAcSP-31430 [Blumeria graminis f. sp. tritici]|uniref:BgtAcSP-31430 n=1 Tax=Blumeria graminis f. sp. tritici TaxID=62690 RepID=A0A9X9ML32_BLUGR|nr:BgtAcSP-31430 [Blumeria graminis f. sp. tritici]